MTEHYSKGELPAEGGVEAIKTKVIYRINVNPEYDKVVKATRNILKVSPVDLVYLVSLRPLAPLVLTTLTCLTGDSDC